MHAKLHPKIINSLFAHRFCEKVYINETLVWDEVKSYFLLKQTISCLNTNQSFISRKYHVDRHCSSQIIFLNSCIKCKKFHMFRNRQGHSSRLIRQVYGQIWLRWPQYSIIWVFHFLSTFQSTINSRECTQLSHFWFPIKTKQNTFTSQN